MPADPSILSIGPAQSPEAGHREQIVRSPYRGLCAILLLILLFLLAGCTSLPADLDKPRSQAIRSGGGTELGRLVAPLVAQHPERSAFVVLDTGRQALSARLALLDRAERAFDAQYYIWNSDRSGNYMAGRLLHAAERGVQVRLLIDDWNTGGRDNALLALNAHPDIEVRVFNPIAARSGVDRWLSFAADFGRLNRRMHDKSFVVDASVAIVGGRNIGDEYFDLSPELNFRDRDLLAVGPIVGSVSEAFDAYWNSDWAYPITAVAKDVPSLAEVEVAQQRLLQKSENKPDFLQASDSAAGDREAGFPANLESAIWAPALLVFDPPYRPDQMTDTNRRKLVAKTLNEFIQAARDEIIVESAYLVLGDVQQDSLGAVRARGVEVKALTNSLASNDVVPNHAAYARTRRAMLERGMEIYELRPDAASCAQLIQNPQACEHGMLLGLHAKSMVIDRDIVYVGSFNLNMRSIYLNFETAMVVFSSELAERIAADIERDMGPKNSWQVKLTDDGTLEWVGLADGKEKIWRQEPEAGFGKRLRSGIWSLFPMEKYF